MSCLKISLVTYVLTQVRKTNVASKLIAAYFIYYFHYVVNKLIAQESILCNVPVELQFSKTYLHEKEWTRISKFTNDDECQNFTNFTRPQLAQLILLWDLDVYVQAEGHFSQQKHYLFHHEELCLYMLICIKGSFTHAHMEDQVMFGTSSCWSYGYRWIISYLYDKYHHLLNLIALPNIEQKVYKYGDKVEQYLSEPRNMSGILNNEELVLYEGLQLDDDEFFCIFGFFDCKTFNICRSRSGPGDNPQGRKPGSYYMNCAFYGGHKQAHGLKVFSILLPNGINYISNSILVQRNNSHIATTSRADEYLVELNNQVLGINNPNNYMILYGNGGFKGQ